MHAQRATRDLMETVWPLPVTKTARIIRGKGVGLARRGRGRRIATAGLAWDQGGGRLTSIAVEQDADGSQRAAAQEAHGLLALALGRLGGYAGQAVVAEVLGGLDGERTAVEYLEDHELLMNESQRHNSPN